MNLTGSFQEVMRGNSIPEVSIPSSGIMLMATPHSGKTSALVCGAEGLNKLRKMGISVDVLATPEQIAADRSLREVVESIRERSSHDCAGPRSP